jgi:hypothetical protein
MKHISSSFAPAGEKRAKTTATDENQNEAITISLVDEFVSIKE